MLVYRLLAYLFHQGFLASSVFMNDLQQRNQFQLLAIIISLHVECFNVVFSDSHLTIVHSFEVYRSTDDTIKTTIKQSYSNHKKGLRQ